jgi:uncharacterized repeat protein (TIGR02543 family)
MKKYVSLLMVFLVAMVMFSACENESPTDSKTKVTFDQKTMEVELNKTETITATTKPANKALTWTSDDEETATVDQEGNVTGVKLGTTNIIARAKDGGKATCSVTVVPVRTIITLTPTSLDVDAGDTASITARTTPTSRGPLLTWTSSDPTVATVNPTTGNAVTVTGVKVGTATITATDPERGGKGECTVTVVAPVNTTVTLNPTTLEVEVDETKTVTATTNPVGKSLTWSSSDPTTATVDSNGNVTGEKVGSATITAKPILGEAKTCTVTVVAATKNYSVVEDQTLVHYLPRLVGANHFGSDLGTTNADGSYTFDGTAGGFWNGGGAQYDFPIPKASAGWQLSDYQLVEMHLKVTSGSVSTGVKKFGMSGDGSDLYSFPDNRSRIAFNAATDEGVFLFKTVIEEAGDGIGFQRETGGPATVLIEKVIFSKNAVHTIKFSGGTNTAMTPIPDMKIPHGRTVNLGSDYVMPRKPDRIDENNVFLGWYTDSSLADDKEFDTTEPVTTDLTLTAKWGPPPPPPDMTLDLNPANWPGYPTAIWTSYPTEYAVPTYDSVTGKLTLTFNGRNRQVGLIAISDEQVNALLDADEVSGVTMRIDAVIDWDNAGVGKPKDDAGVEETSARFRCHIGNPAMGTWNSTAGADDKGWNESPLDKHLVEFRNFTGTRSPNYKWFFFQAMYRDPNAAVLTTNNNIAAYPIVTMVITSVKLDLNDTRTEEEREAEEKSREQYN